MYATATPSRDTTATGGLKPALVLLALFAGLLVLMPALQLWDRDEPLYARTALEMLLSGNFILPQFNGDVFAHKTPLVYWLMAGSMAIFGPTEFGARFVSGPAMVGSVWLTFLIGRRLFDANTALRAMLLLGAALLSLYLGAAAMTDAVLLFTICLALWAYLAMVQPLANRVGWLALFTVAMCLSLLAKGPVGPAVIVAALLASWFTLPRDNRPGWGLFAAGIAGSLLAFAGFLAWAIPANLQSGGSMVEQGIGIHMIGRALAPMEGHGASGIGGWIATLPIYLPVIWLGFLPGTLALPAAIAGLWRGTIGNRHARAFLWGWILPILVIFSLVSTKLPHYIFPIFPALAIAAGAAWPAMSRTVRRVGYAAFALPYLAAGAALALLPFTGIGLPIAASLLTAAVILAYVVATGLSLRQGMPSLMFLSLGAYAIIGLLYWAVLPPLETSIKLSKSIAAELNTLPAGTTIYMTGYSEPSLVFYANRPLGEPIKWLPHDDDALLSYLATPGESYIVATGARADLLRASEGTRPFQVISRAEARNTNAAGKAQTIFLLRRPALGDM